MAFSREAAAGTRQRYHPRPLLELALVSVKQPLEGTEHPPDRGCGARSCETPRVAKPRA